MCFSVFVRVWHLQCLIGVSSSFRVGSMITEAARVAGEAAKRDLKIQSRALSIAYGKITDLKPKVSLFSCVFNESEQNCEH